MTALQDNQRLYEALDALVRAFPPSVTFCGSVDEMKRISEAMYKAKLAIKNSEAAAFTHE